MNDIKEETEKFLDEVAKSRGMVGGLESEGDGEDDGLVPMRRKRSLDSHMPDYVKEVLLLFFTVSL